METYNIMNLSSPRYALHRKTLFSCNGLCLPELYGIEGDVCEDLFMKLKSSAAKGCESERPRK